jgi:hypothetical protein
MTLKRDLAFSNATSKSLFSTYETMGTDQIKIRQVQKQQAKKMVLGVSLSDSDVDSISLQQLRLVVYSNGLKGISFNLLIFT